MAKYASFYVSVNSADPIKAGVVISIGEVTRTKTMNEDDDLETAESGYSQKSPGMRNVEDITFVIRHNKTDAGQTLLDDSYNNDELIDFDIRYPDSNKTSFKGQGYVSSIATNAQDKDTIRVERTITISVNGALTEGTWTPAV